eukprot:scaffold1280_cov246-Pinguiococcus_pyrenoidosus.AAC.10
MPSEKCTSAGNAFPRRHASSVFRRSKAFAIRLRRIKEAYYRFRSVRPLSHRHSTIFKSKSAPPGVATRSYCLRAQLGRIWGQRNRTSAFVRGVLGILDNR